MARTAKRGRVAAFIAVMLAAPSLVATAAAASSTEPVIATGQLSAAPGTQVRVTGAGWPARTLVHLEICGNEAANGSVDCSIPTAVDVAASSSGEFFAVLTTAMPPTACPCVVRASMVSGDAIATRRIEITGAPTGPVTRSPLPNLTDYLAISDAHFESAPGWTSWFGASFTRQLVVTVRNSGPDRVDTTEVEVTSGRGEDPTGFVAARRLGAIAKGASKTFRIPVPFDAMSFGNYRVKVRISGFGEPVIARRSTSTYPWALFVSVAVVVQLALLALRNRARRRLVAVDEPIERTTVAAEAIAPPPARTPIPEMDALITDAREEWTRILAFNDELLAFHPVPHNDNDQECLMSATESSDAAFRELITSMHAALDNVATIAERMRARAEAEAAAIRAEAEQVLAAARAEADGLVDRARSDVRRALIGVERTLNGQDAANVTAASTESPAAAGSDTLISTSSVVVPPPPPASA
jgi:hypothetical protein